MRQKEKKVIKLLQHQEKLIDDCKYNELAIIGGLGSGKTHFGARWIIKRFFQNPDSPLCCVLSATRQLVKDVNLEYVKTFLNEIGLVEENDYSINKSELIMTFENNRKIIFKSAEQWKSILSYEFHSIWADEPGRWPEDAIKDISGRLRCSQATQLLQMLFTGVCQGENWYAHRFSGESFVRDGQISYSKDLSRKVLHARTFDNKFLPSSYLKRLETELGKDTPYYKAWVLGEIVSLTGESCYDYDSSQHSTDVKISNEIQKIYCSWDFNPGKVSLVAVQKFRDAWVAIKENKIRCKDTFESCLQFEEMFNKHKHVNTIFYIDGDPAGYHPDTRAIGMHDYDIIEKQLKPNYNIKIIAKRAAPRIVARIATVNKHLRNKTLLINEKECPGLSRSMNATRYDDGGKIDKPKGEDWTHRSDALGYLLHNLDPLQLDYTQKGGHIYV